MFRRISKPFLRMCAGAGLLLCTILLGRPFLEAAFSDWLHERESRRFLRKLGLPEDAEHLDLVGVMTRPRHPPPFERVPGEEAEEFAEGIPYSILEERNLRVTVYREDVEAWRYLGPLMAGLAEKGSERGVELSLAQNDRELADALRDADIVIFSGHANFGKGLRIRDGSSGGKLLWTLPGAEPDALAHDVSEKFDTLPRHPFPDIRAPLFFNLGCRSDRYYREAHRRMSPETGLVLTHYAWAPGIRFGDALEILIDAVHARRTLPEVLEAWELLYLDEKFFGRSRERLIYRNDDPFPASLFVLHPKGL